METISGLEAAETPEAPMLDPEDEDEEALALLHPEDTYLKKRIQDPPGCSPKRCWLVILGILGALAILAYGIAFGLSRKSRSSVPVGPEMLTNGAIKESSIATVLATDGSRHLFFQDINGSLRHAIYSQAINSWLASVDFIITDSRPRNHTPIAALPTENAFGADGFYLFFVNTDDIAVSQEWSMMYLNQITFDPLKGTFWNVAPATRSISVTRLLSNVSEFRDIPPPDPGIVMTDEALLFFEAPNGNLTVFYGIISFWYDKHITTTSGWSWRNVTDEFHAASIGSGLGLKGSDWIAAPFATARSTSRLVIGLFSNGGYAQESNSRGMIFWMSLANSSFESIFISEKCFFTSKLRFLQQP